MTVHDGVGDRAVDLGFDHVGVGVPHVVHADPGDEIILHGAVGEFHQSAVTDAASEVLVEESAAAKVTELFEQGLILLFQFRVRRSYACDFLLVLFDRCAQELLGFCNTWILKKTMANGLHIYLLR